MGKKLGGRALTEFEEGRDIWQSVLDGVRELRQAVADGLWWSLAHHCLDLKPKTSPANEH